MWFLIDIFVFNCFFVAMIAVYAIRFFNDASPICCTVKMNYIILTSVVHYPG